LLIVASNFQSFCHKTADIIIDKYSWLPMTATVHKILEHLADIIQHTVLPFGYFGEDGPSSTMPENAILRKLKLITEK